MPGGSVDATSITQLFLASQNVELSVSTLSILFLTSFLHCKFHALACQLRRACSRKAFGASNLSIMTSTSWIFLALANVASSRSLESSRLLWTVQVRERFPSESPRTLKRPVQFQLEMSLYFLKQNLDGYVGDGGIE